MRDPRPASLREREQTERERGGKSEDQGEEKVTGDSVEHHRQIGPEHVLDAMREIDEVHHAEHERQAGRDQEQQHAELQAVEGLDDEQGEGHYRSPSPRPAERGEGAEQALAREAGEGLM